MDLLFSCSVVSNSWWPHESQHTRPPCPSPTPGVHSNSRPSNWWCYLAISSSVVPFSSCPQSLPASESFPMSQLFAWGGQSTGVSCQSPNSQSLLKLRLIEWVMPSNHLILCHSLLLPPSIFPSIRVLSNELSLHIRWPKDWSFSFSISPSNEYSALISFRIDWFDLLAVQGTLKSLLQHHSSKASVLWCSVFFMVQLSHP